MSNKPDKIIYTAVATAVGGRAGRAETSDGRLKVDLSVQKELGGPADGTGTNPEQLFAAGYAACFGSSIEVVAKRKHVALSGITVTSHVGIGPNSHGGYGLAVRIEVTLSGIPHADAQRLIEAAHGICPYSNATRGNVDVALNVVDG